ncbi:MAG: DUF2325 domain-containing protein [Pseudanabaenaceae cyanobacterium]|jgi:hypothetical protein
MHISELDDLEASVNELLSVAKVELEQKRLQKQKERQIHEILSQIEGRLQPMLKKIEQMLEQLEKEAILDPDHVNPTKAQLEQKRAEIREQLESAPLMAAREADRQLILSEERLWDQREAEQLSLWRQELKADLLDMIEEQRDFYSATDASIAIRSHITDLKAIGCLDEVVEALINQINAHSEEGPVARLRGTHEQTLTFIYNKALENRARVDRSPDVQPSTRHRKSEKRPSLYTELSGKVLVFGGHDRLQTAVKNRLRDSNVNLVWYTEQDGLQLATQGETQIPSSDLIIIVTGYASHSLTERAIEACRRAGKTYEIINTTGMTRVLELIESSLKAKQLARHWNTQGT